jgi:hypothetical protein
MKSLFALTLALALVLQAGSARAATQWIVDDTCVKASSGSYFYLGGPLSGWFIHSGSGVGNPPCHLYNWTEATSLPVNWAHYLLKPESAYDGSYTVYQHINCEHNAPRYKYYRLANGSGGGVTSIHTTATHLPCGTAPQVIPKLPYCASCGASIRLVDNVPVAAEPQNAEWLLFNP